MKDVMITRINSLTVPPGGGSCYWCSDRLYTKKKTWVYANIFIDGFIRSVHVGQCCGPDAELRPTNIMMRNCDLSAEQLLGTAVFIWMFSEIFFLELEDGNCTIWSSRMYSKGDGSLLLTDYTYEIYCKEYGMRCGIWGRDKGVHSILDYLSREDNS